MTRVEREGTDPTGRWARSGCAAMLACLAACGPRSEGAAADPMLRIAHDEPGGIPEPSSLVQDLDVPALGNPCSEDGARACAVAGSAAVLRCEGDTWVNEAACAAACTEDGRCLLGCRESALGPMCACTREASACSWSPRCDGVHILGDGNADCQDICMTQGADVTVGCVHDPRVDEAASCRCADLGDPCEVPGARGGCMRSSDTLPDHIAYDALAVCEGGVWSMLPCADVCPAWVTPDPDDAVIECRGRHPACHPCEGERL